MHYRKANTRTVLVSEETTLRFPYMHVEFVSPCDHSPQTGIGRYIHTMVRHLSGSVDLTIRSPRFIPLAGRLSPLKNLPIGIQDHMPGSIVHFPQIMGCAMMLYRPYHPSVATVHDLGFLELPEEWQMLDPVARRLLRLSLAGLKRVDSIVAVSEFTRQGVIKHLGVSEDRVVAIHSGIDHELFRPIVNARQAVIDLYPRLSAIASAPWLLYVGSELPRKNVGTLLQALALLREEMPDVRLIKVGSAGGEHFRRETLHTIGQLGLGDQVLIFEGVADDALPLFYNAADLFVTASKLEGFGLPVLEAMACGAPVVCSDAGALPEVVGKAGRTVPAHGASMLSEALARVLTDPQLRRWMAQRGRERSQSFTWEQAAAETAAVYRGLPDSDLAYPKARARGRELRWEERETCKDRSKGASATDG